MESAFVGSEDAFGRSDECLRDGKITPLRERQSSLKYSEQ